MDNIIVILISKTNADFTLNQVRYLQATHNVSLQSIVVVAESQEIELINYLEQQQDINYIIYEQQKETITSVLNICIKEFMGENNLLIMTSDYVLLQDALENMENILDSSEKIYGVSPATIIKGQGGINNLEDAINYQLKQNNKKIYSYIMKPLYNTILLSSKMFLNENVFDTKLETLDVGYTDFFVNSIINDKKIAIANNAYQFKLSDNVINIDAMEKDNGYLRNKWKMNYFNLKPHEYLVDFIDKDENADFNVLEIGCDCGATLLDITSSFPNSKVYGVEINENSARIARHVANIKVQNIETSFELWDNVKFDYIIFGDVLEHLHNPYELVRKCRDILVPHGKLICSIPNLMHYSVLHDLIDGNFTYTDAGLLDKTHIHFFTYNEIIRMFDKFNYNIKDMRIVKLSNDDNNDVEFVNELTRISKHKNEWEFRAYQYLIVAEML